MAREARARLFELTTAQMAELAAIIKAAGLSQEIAPAKIQGEYSSRPGFRSKTHPKFRFAFDEYRPMGGGYSRPFSGGLTVSHYPNSDGVEGWGFGINWDQAVERFEDWLMRVKENLAAKPFWQILNEPLPNSADEQTFTAAEIPALRSELAALEERWIAELGLRDDQIKTLRAEMEVLRDQVAKANRGFFRRTFYGAMIKLALEAGFDQLKLTQMWEDVLARLRDFFPTNLLPPGIGQ